MQTLYDFLLIFVLTLVFIILAPVEAVVSFVQRRIERAFKRCGLRAARDI